MAACRAVPATRERPFSGSVPRSADCPALGFAGFAAAKIRPGGGVAAAVRGFHIHLRRGIRWTMVCGGEIATYLAQFSHSGPRPAALDTAREAAIGNKPVALLSGRNAAGGSCCDGDNGHHGGAADHLWRPEHGGIFRRNAARQQERPRRSGDVDRPCVTECSLIVLVGLNDMRRHAARAFNGFAAGTAVE